jgi:hypothetical protein
MVGVNAIFGMFPTRLHFFHLNNICATKHFLRGEKLTLKNRRGRLQKSFEIIFFQKKVMREKMAKVLSFYAKCFANHTHCEYSQLRSTLTAEYVGIDMLLLDAWHVNTAIKSCR